MSKKRAAILMVSTVGIAACFIPLKRSPTVASTLAIQVAQGIACGIYPAILAFSVLAHTSRWRSLARKCVCSLAAALIVLVAVFRAFALTSHSLPRFANDDPRAVPLYQEVCDKGEMAACTLLGTCYWTGTCGVAKEQSRAVELFQKACDGGELGACGQLACCYEIGGCGLPRNGLKAVSLYEKACLGGEMSMCNNLGICFHKGQCGVGKDVDRAVDLYRRACDGGDSGACHNLELVGR